MTPHHPTRPDHPGSSDHPHHRHSVGSHHTPHHLRPQQRLGRIHQGWVYGAGTALALSGIGWLICHYLLSPPEPLSRNPLEPWWMRLHGLALLTFLTVWGSVLPVHVRYGWRYRMSRGSGAVVLTVISLLALSGYGLYYLVDDDLRAWTSLTHWITGLAAIAVLSLHVLLARRARG